ncbi:MAG: C25 family cysteine peptidase [Halobacteriota archaeon]
MKELKALRIGPAIFIVALVILISTLPFSPLVSANVGLNNETVINIEFNTSDLSFHTFENYDIVRLKGCQLKRDVGEPALPMKSIFLVIPPKARITDLEILSSEKIAIEGEYGILPAQPPVPVSTLTYQNEPKFAIQNASLYSSPNIYPGEIFRYTGEGNLRGHRIVSITIFPVQYAPAEKRLIFHKNITLRINYTTPQLITSGLAVTEKSRFDSIVKRLVSNHDDVNRFAYQKNPAPSKSALSPYDEVKYVIITNESLKDAFQPLADWKTMKGVPAKIVTVSWINAGYPGNDTQARIRNFIRDAYMTWSTEWVLLGGDTDVIPCRGAYGYVNGSAASPAGEWWDYNIPADLYYACLNGNWNADNNSIYGEVCDDVDLLPDVFIGRAPVNTIAEVQTFVNKTLRYEKNPPMDYELDMLFLGEMLWNEPITYGGVIKNRIDEDCVPPEYEPITKKYEMYGNASAAIAISEMNDGPHIVNHVGHGYYGGFSVNGWVSSGDADGLTNSPKNFILYSISCMSNGFDHNSVSEHYMNNPDGGTVAYIGNSRYGFFEPGQPGDGPSDLYDQEFFNSIFNDDFYHIGEAVADSKVAYTGYSQEDGDGMRWLQYAINLLGDPGLTIWTEIPKKFTINKPSAIPADTAQEIVIQVLNESEPVQNATVCIMKDDDGIYSVSETDSSGNVSFSISPGAGALNVTVTKHNFVPNESMILVVEETQEKPDLVITEKWVCWPDNCTICYNVTNIGNGTAPAGHNTTLYVDGIEVAHDQVPVELAPNSSYIGCFEGYDWIYAARGQHNGMRG